MDILTNYLSNRQQKTIVNNSISSLKPVPYGVPQGSVLGPTLFIMYINDVVKIIEKSSCYLYADDMVIFNPLRQKDSMSELQSDINNIYKWCNANKLTINISKTKAQYFPKNSNINTKDFYNKYPITINNTKLEYDKNLRYLGIVHIYFVNMDISLIITLICLKNLYVYSLDISRGKVSQNLDIGLSFCFIV